MSATVANGIGKSAPRLDAKSVGWLLLLAALLAFPSGAKVQRYFGTAAVGAYAASVVVVLILGYRFVFPVLMRRMTERASLWLFFATLILLVAAFFAVFPVVSLGLVGGGSDRDEALNVGVAELLHGKYPYYARTHVANTISPMPGGLFFATPFVLMGDAAYENFFWIAALFFAVRRLLRDGRLALLFVWLVIFLAPVGLHEVLSGGDLLSNTIWVLLFTLFLVETVCDPSSALWKKALASVLFGVGLSSRIHFILVGPIVLSMLVQHAGWKKALGWMTVSSFAWIVVTMPFYLHDPAQFAPFALVEGRFGVFEELLPHAQVIIPGIGGLLALGLALRRMDRGGARMLDSCAVPIAWLIVMATALWSVHIGRFDLDKRAWYGISFMLFGALACLMRLAPGTPSAGTPEKF